MKNSRPTGCYAWGGGGIATEQIVQDDSGVPDGLVVLGSSAPNQSGNRCVAIVGLATLTRRPMKHPAHDAGFRAVEALKKLDGTGVEPRRLDRRSRHPRRPRARAVETRSTFHPWDRGADTRKPGAARNRLARRKLRCPARLHQPPESHHVRPRVALVARRGAGAARTFPALSPRRNVISERQESRRPADRQHRQVAKFVATVARAYAA